MPDERRTAWFCQKVEKLQQGMYVLSVSILGNKEDAEDAMQNTLLQAYQHLDELRAFEKLKPWLFRILTRECCRLLKLRTWDIDIEEIDPPLSADTDTDMQMTLWQAVQALPAGYRTVIVLFYYEGMSISDIAKTLELSLDAVKKRLSRGRDQLRGMLREEDLV